MRCIIVPGYLSYFFRFQNVPIHIYRPLRLDQQAGAGHLLGLGQTHDSEDGGSDVTKDTVGLLQAVALGSVCHDKGNLVQGVRCLGGVFLVQHLLGVAVVGGDEEGVAALLALLVNLANSLVGLGAGNDGSVVDTGVADHVRGSEVVHEELKLALLDALTELVGNSHGAHLGLLVVGRDARGRDHVSVLVVELDLDTSVEEESDVGVLLGLGDVALVDLLLGKPLGEDVVHGLGSKGEREGVVGLVAGHGGDVHVGGVGEVGLGAAVLVADELGDLADTVAAVVEEEEGIVVCCIESVMAGRGRMNGKHTLDSAVLAIDDNGLQELVSLTSLVALLDSLDGVGRLLALAFEDADHGLLNTLPALVAVHGEVTSNNGSDLAETDLLSVVDDSLHVAGTGLGVGITTVTEEVDVDLGHADLLGDVEESEKVVDVRVDTTVRDQTEQVQTAVALLCAGEALDDVVDLVEFALLDGLVDADNVLPDDSAGANVQVTDLTVSHETLGKTDSERRGFELRVALGNLAALLGELVHPGSVGVQDGVTLVGRLLASDTPSVNADEDCLLCDLCHVVCLWV